MSSAAHDVLTSAFVVESLGLASATQYNDSTVTYVKCLAARGSANSFAFNISSSQQSGASLPNTTATAGAPLRRQRQLLHPGAAMQSGGGGGGGGQQAQLFNGYTLLSSSSAVHYDLSFTQVGGPADRW